MIIINGYLCEKLPMFANLIERKKSGRGIYFGQEGRVYKQIMKLDPAMVEILIADVGGGAIFSQE